MPDSDNDAVGRHHPRLVLGCSETPETDKAALFVAGHDRHFHPGEPVESVFAEFARRLERERNHYRALAAELARQNSALREIMDAPKCTCDGTTGSTEIRCCNICGLPHKDEIISWAFTPENDQIQA